VHLVGDGFHNDISNAELHCLALSTPIPGNGEAISHQEYGKRVYFTVSMIIIISHFFLGNPTSS